MTIAEKWVSSVCTPGHPMEVGNFFLERILPNLTRLFNENERDGQEPVPHLAALVCCSPFDLAVHDAFGVLHDVSTYETYNTRYMTYDLAHFLTPAPGSDISFTGRFPEEFLTRPRLETIPAWHLIGGKDPIGPDELTGTEPNDGYPVLLRDWIRRDGLKCLKVKLRGDDFDWDYDRLTRVGQLAIEEGALWLTADFNCTVHEPEYVNAMLDRLVQGASTNLRDASLCGTTLSLRSGGPSH